MEGAVKDTVNPEHHPAGFHDLSDPGATGDGAPPLRAGRPAAVLRALVKVHDDEIGVLLWSCLFLFCLLAGNYLIRPVRDEMGIAGGTANLPVLFAGTFVVMLALGPLLSSRLRPRKGRPGIDPIIRAHQLSLVTFFVAFQVLPSSGQLWAARAFFVLASVANLLVVSIAWGSLVCRFTTDQAHRLFGFIAAGGTLGAIAGSAIAGTLAVPAGPTPLLVVAIGFLELSLLAARRALAPSTNPRTGQPHAQELDDLDGTGRPSQRIYLLGLGLWTLLFTISSAFVYLEQARIVHAAITDPSVRTSFFARIDLLVNVLGLALQVLVTGRALAFLGAGGSAAMLPVVTLAGALLLALRPTVATVQWFQVARRAVDYAIARPSREVFYTAVGRAELLGAKGLIDTAVYRAGDAAGAWAYGLLAAMPSLSAPAPVALVPLSLFWIVLSLGLGRAMNRRGNHPERRNE
jgi:ATP:ADP antiporter, AAA family